MTPSDAALIAQVLAADDHAAFAELIRRHQSAVRHFLRHLTRGDDALADDLAQETFIQAYRGLARFAGTAKFSTWLFGIAHNRWRNARRRVPPIALAADRLEAIEPAVSTVNGSDLRHDLADVLARLSPDEQAALHLCYQQGLSHPEAAAVLQWPLGTVKTHVARGKEKLRSILVSWNPKN